MCVWAGLFVMAGPAVWRRCPWTLASPLFTFLLIRYMSGQWEGGAAQLAFGVWVQQLGYTAQLALGVGAA